MTWLAIGRAGGAIRMFVRNPAQAEAQRQDGEVIVAANDDSAVSISDDGETLIATVLSAEQIEAAILADIRAERNRRLAASDWTQGRDTPLSAEKIVEWATYREALRDLPATANPIAIVWPVVPE
jgi:hypothetical protein